jgi:ABC-type polysaccharide transport system permease subunit
MLSVGFDQYLLFFNGLTASKITVLDLYVYRQGILSNDFSYTTAICMIKTLVSVALLLIANRLLKVIRGYGMI